MEENQAPQFELTETQRQLVELYARDPNPTKIARELGVHRSTVHRRLDEPGVRDS
jgi:IS30 family transposase